MRKAEDIDASIIFSAAVKRFCYSLSRLCDFHPKILARKEIDDQWYMGARLVCRTRTFILFYVCLTTLS